MDREKVIKGIKCHRKKVQTTNAVSCLECPYAEPKPIREWCMSGLMDDIYAMLKEQDGKPMIENERGWNCPSCGMVLIGKTASGYPCDLIDLPEDEPIHFCPMCGQAVKLE